MPPGKVIGRPPVEVVRQHGEALPGTVTCGSARPCPRMARQVGAPLSRRPILAYAMGIAVMLIAPIRRLAPAESPVARTDPAREEWHARLVGTTSAQRMAYRWYLRTGSWPTDESRSP